MKNSIKLKSQRNLTLVTVKKLFQGSKIKTTKIDAEKKNC